MRVFPTPSYMDHRMRPSLSKVPRILININEFTVFDIPSSGTGHQPGTSRVLRQKRGCCLTLPSVPERQAGPTTSRHCLFSLACIPRNKRSEINCSKDVKVESYPQMDSRHHRRTSTESVSPLVESNLLPRRVCCLDTTSTMSCSSRSLTLCTAATNRSSPATPDLLSGQALRVAPFEPSGPVSAHNEYYPHTRLVHAHDPLLEARTSR